MNIQSLRLRAVAFVAGVAMLAISGFASADPPSRVVRLGYTTGAVSFSPAGEEDWVQATMNRPLTIGDRLWVDSGARAELQIGGAILRLNAGTSVMVLNLDDNVAQLQLTQGTMNVRVRRFDPGQVLEVDTPNLAFTVRQAGDYRIGVDTEGNATDLIVRKGQGEVYGEGASYVVDSRQPYRFTGTGLREYEPLAAPRGDDFDRWALDRDRVYDTSVSARYVSPDVIGYQDLDTNGTWSTDATYGNVWYPTRVAADWAPYRDGHWAWVDPWGWTWVDDAPWGFAVSHYGRWSHVRGRWGWIPGPVATRAYYAPALVAFVGGNNFQLSISSGNVGGVGWFPLGPREVYRPWYSTSRRYFEQVNVSNTVVNTTVINNYYNNTNVTNVNYVNRQVPGAVVAVPTTAFVQSQQVARSAVRVTPQMAASAPVTQAVAVMPTERSVRGAAAQGDKPPARVFERAVVARTAPAPAQASFAAQQQQLQTRQGKPLDEAARKQIQAAPATPAPNVKVVAQPRAAPPTAALPAGLAGQDPRTRGAPAPATAGAPSAPAPGTAQGTAPAQVAQPGAAPQPPERGKGQQRGVQPETPPTAATRGVTPAPGAAAQPQASMPPPAVAPAEKAATADERGKDQQRAKGEQRGRLPEAPPQVAAPGIPPSSPSQTRVQGPAQQQAEQQTRQAEQQQARQAEQQKAREAQAAQQQTRQVEQQKAREAQAAQQQTRQAEQQQAQAAQQQARQAEQQKAREAQAAQQQTRQAEQQKAREAQAAQQQTRQAEQQKAREAQAAQQQTRQAEQQKAREAQAAQQQAQQQARQAQAAQQQAQQQQARQAQAAQQQARQAAEQQARAQAAQAQTAQPAQPPTRGAAPRGNEKKDSDEQKREEEARKQKG